VHRRREMRLRRHSCGFWAASWDVAASHRWLATAAALLLLLPLMLLLIVLRDRARANQNR
jgi:hypothetical protein